MAESIKMRVEGMDCPSCAAKIEKAVGSLPKVASVKVSIASQIMTVTVPEADREQVTNIVTNLGYKVSSAEEAAPAQSEEYRRALWLVVILNAAYGVVEIVGGFIAGSQALKADALDFLGDGAITFLGIVAIGWSLAWRAKSALIQGLFLGVLGLGVLANTIYRMFAVNVPESDIMGVLGVSALGVNLAAALILLPHRKGDANVRAVWLFSRNDAIGNAAVVVAAWVVYLTGTGWPDLAVAFIISGLFLHSAIRIMRDASAELRGVRGQ